MVMFDPGETTATITITVNEDRGDLEHAVEYVRRFLEVAAQERANAWTRLEENSLA
jgi:hypothetical protein